eukprot:9441569-Pyramimonas_sp.AAC.1
MFEILESELPCAWTATAKERSKKKMGMEMWNVRITMWNVRITIGFHTWAITAGFHCGES